MNEIYDVVIVGAGPAGLTAAIYASRAMLKYVVLEKRFPGGEIVSTIDINNYPGLPNISGFDLTTKMVDHAKGLGTEIRSEEVLEIDISQTIKKVVTDTQTYLTKTVILATGAQSKTLGLENEASFVGRGVAYCATCDGALYKGKVTAVIGGGDVALEDAIFLSRMCPKVYLIHRRHEFRAAKVTQEKILNYPNIEIVYDTVVTSIKGSSKVTGIEVENLLTKKKSILAIKGLFVAVGYTPSSGLLKGKVNMTDEGWIITDENCLTNVPGIYASGDIRKKLLRQLVTSVSDGAVAIKAIENDL